MPMKLFSGFSMVCSHLYRPGFARSNHRTYRQPCKLPNKLVRRWHLQLLHKVATNHTSVMFPLPFPLLFPLPLICARRLCPWSWVVRVFLARAIIAARLGVGQQSTSCRSDRLLTNQLPTNPTKKRASFRAIEASFQMSS